MQALVIATSKNFMVDNADNLSNKNFSDVQGICGVGVWDLILAQKEYLLKDTTMILCDDRVYTEEEIQGVLSEKSPSMMLWTGLRLYKDSRIYVMDRAFWNGMNERSVMESLFASGEDKLSRYQCRYGGYWRYASLYDFCYLVNPCFPTERFQNEMKDSFVTLMQSYPSGMGVNSALAAEYFALSPMQICVGNGSSELIKSLMERFVGKIGCIYPTFEEYPHRKQQSEIVPFVGLDGKFNCTVDDIATFYEDKSVDAIILVNPDNPTGRFLLKDELLRLAKWCQEKDIYLVVDESFMDFSGMPKESLLCQEVLNQYKNLIVIKSISKSYGVPGLRLGILATSNEELVATMKKDVSIWNVNSFGEFFWQIIGKYKYDYEKAIGEFIRIRARYMENLGRIKNLVVYPTYSNYVMCKIEGGMTATKLATIMLNRYNILVKDLTGKAGLEDGEYIRLSVRADEENNYIVRVLEELL